ncbi:NUMOD4 domain-containing protein [Chryseobacterium candidae]|uniref:NUMOD4 domain-containing protein n=1 Tax=Chryseobacterium candidae TaxID=1978493 RepID=A0ABY2R7A5_9FLAO|nr:NUMOD4 domain-containing protein [Chryseobacterium candidae]THV57541.1 hypothetical protein EK417_16115 [Chryseobacterium candidae]
MLNKALWKKLGKPEIDQNNPPACMNLSLKDLPGEEWKPLPGFEKQFSISNKGRIKRLNTWTDNKIKTFLNEHITSLNMNRLKNTDTYYIYALLNHNGKRPRITIARMLYYCFVETFDLNNKSLAVVNKNKPLWDMDLSKLFLYHQRQLIKESKALAPIKIRTILNSKKNFNDLLWERFGKPYIDKNSPPAILDLSLKNLPGEEWKPLPGFEGKYVISNKGRVKRLSGWGVGTHFYGEEQIVSINIMKENEYSYLVFREHKKESRNVNILPRLLYYCFVQEFDLNNKALVVVNENEPIWDMQLSKLSLHSAGSLRK